MLLCFRSGARVLLAWGVSVFGAGGEQQSHSPDIVGPYDAEAIVA